MKNNCTNTEGGACYGKNPVQIMEGFVATKIKQKTVLFNQISKNIFVFILLLKVNFNFKL
jgi:hypothetical protein